MVLELLPCYTSYPIPILSPFPSRCQSSQSQFLVYTSYFFFFFFWCHEQVAVNFLMSLSF